MALKIRLRRQGRTNSAFFRFVVTDSRSPRDGKYLEALGWYNPEKEGEQKLSVDSNRVRYWLDIGAQLTESAQSLIKRTCPEVIQALAEKRAARRAKRALKRKSSKAVS